VTVPPFITEVTFLAIFFGLRSVLLLTAKTLCGFTERTLHGVSPNCLIVVFRFDGISISKSSYHVKQFFIILQFIDNKKEAEASFM
jgi:hypothetical protein